MPKAERGITRAPARAHIVMARSSVAILAVILSGACSNQPEPMRPVEEPRQFGEAEKAAARTLSIGNYTVLERADGPYAEALLCSNAVTALAGRLDEAGGLAPQQANAIREAQSIFERRLGSLGLDEGRTQAQIDQDLRQTARENPDSASNARIAIACLQNLVAEG